MEFDETNGAAAAAETRRTAEAEQEQQEQEQAAKFAEEARFRREEEDAEAVARRKPRRKQRSREGGASTTGKQSEQQEEEGDVLDTEEVLQPDVQLLVTSLRHAVSHRNSSGAGAGRPRGADVPPRLESDAWNWWPDPSLNNACVSQGVLSTKSRAMDDFVSVPSVCK
jgi:hypothetical protein